MIFTTAASVGDGSGLLCTRAHWGVESDFE